MPQPVSELKNGPLNKSICTQNFELIIKCLIYLQCEKKLFIKNNALYLKIKEFEFNLSTLLEKTNFSHLSLAREDSEAFFKIKESMDELLSFGERFSLVKWTGDDYQEINELLYDSVSYFTKAHSKYDLIKTLIIIAFIASAVNKIEPSGAAMLYRGEGKLSKKEIQERIHLLAQGESITKSKGYIATTTSQHIANLYAERNSQITFEESGGKSIIRYSTSLEEEEHLFVPGSLIYWQQHLQKGKHYFKARVVVPLIAEEEYTVEDITALDNLLDIAEAEDVSITFITPYALNILTRQYSRFSLRQAIKKGDVKQIERYVKHNFSMIEPLNCLKQTALHLVALNNQSAVFNRLVKVVKSQTDPNLTTLQKVDAYGLTPVEYFLFHHQSDIFMYYVPSLQALIDSKKRILQVLLQREISLCLNFLKQNTDLVEECLKDTLFCQNMKNAQRLLALFEINPLQSFVLLENNKFKNIIIAASKEDKKYLLNFYAMLPLTLKENPLVKEIIGKVYLQFFFSIKGIIHYLRYHLDGHYRRAEEEKAVLQFAREVKTTIRQKKTAIAPSLTFKAKRKSIAIDIPTIQKNQTAKRRVNLR